MLCPNCGTKTTTEHKFCRHCGMNLEPVSRALAAHFALGGAASAAVARDAERGATRPTAGGLFAGIFVFLLGMLMMRYLPGTAFKAVGAVITILSVVFSLVVVLSWLSAARRGGAKGAPAPQIPDGAPSTGRLLHEQTLDHVPTSVTDHTTVLLNVEVKDRKPRD